MQIFNEYIHIDRIVKTGTGRHIFRYEPTDHKMNTETLGGSVVLFGQSEILFHCDQRSLYNCKLDIHPHDNNWLMSGVIGPDRMLKFVWDTHPGDEHFLCIHYETPDLEDTYKTNWLQEGF